MHVQGIQPDAPLYNSLMEVLWQSGILLAQARAFQLWAAANRNGQFRCAWEVQMLWCHSSYDFPYQTKGIRSHDSCSCAIFLQDFHQHSFRGG